MSEPVIMYVSHPDHQIVYRNQKKTKKIDFLSGPPVQGVHRQVQHDRVALSHAKGVGRSQAIVSWNFCFKFGHICLLNLEMRLLQCNIEICGYFCLISLSQCFIGMDVMYDSQYECLSVAWAQCSSVWTWSALNVGWERRREERIDSSYWSKNLMSYDCMHRTLAWM